VPVTKQEKSYKYLCVLITLTLCIGFPVMSYSPVIFGGVSMQIMPTSMLIGNLISIIVGIWYAVAAIYLTRNQKRFAASFLNPTGGEIIILVVPYVIYLGTKSMLGFGRE